MVLAQPLYYVPAQLRCELDQFIGIVSRHCAGAVVFRRITFGAVRIEVSDIRFAVLSQNQRQLPSSKDAFGCACWTQDRIHWAYAGKAAEAADGLVRRFRIGSTMCRFSWYGHEGPDFCPDFDLCSFGATALQRMLVQEAGGKVLLLPAWPADWDVDFKLHLTGGAVLTGVVKDGKLLRWDLNPSTRKMEVVVCQPQSRPATPCIPPNAHPLRAGADQNGDEHFRGLIARVAMFRGKLSPQTIQALAARRKLTTRVEANGQVEPLREREPT